MPAIKSRFEVSTEGMRELHAGRKPWMLIKELIANAWDEPTVTNVGIRIEAVTSQTTRIIVEDDGEGFDDPTHAYTILAPTAKRGNPTARGRYNLGEKEVISVARSAFVETVGITIKFPPEGGYQRRKNNRTVGTIISVDMPWGMGKARTMAKKLQTFIQPANVATIILIEDTVMGMSRPDPVTTFNTYLSTVIQDGPGEPLRPTYRHTDVHVYTPKEGKGWIYEMGIPIQEIDCPYSVDIQQKVPTPPNRDTVSEYYLHSLYADLLNNTYDRLDEETFSDTWVRAAMEQSNVTKEATQSVIQGRYGNKAVLWSSNGAANERAIESGYQIVHPRTMSTTERNNITGKGEMKRASDLFQIMMVPPDGDIEITPAMQFIARFAQWVGHIVLDRDIRVAFYNLTGSEVAAEWLDENATLQFNIARLGEGWFTTVAKEKHLNLILHELAHAGPSHEGDTPHGAGFSDRVSSLSAKFAWHIGDCFTKGYEEINAFRQGTVNDSWEGNDNEAGTTGKE